MTSTLGINDIQPRNLEAPRSGDLLPEQIRVTATNFLTLLTEYYKFMNINEWTTSTVTLNTYTLSSTTGTVLSGKSGSGPTNIIYSILSQLDVDQVDSDYLSHIQRAVAPYVPIPTYMLPAGSSIGNPAPFYYHLSDEERSFLRAQLYRRIIKYFYNTRGSRNSAISFFQIFYNDTASTYDASTYPTTIENYIQAWLSASGMPIAATTVSGGSVVYGQTPIQAWTPFSYVITSGIDVNTFDVPYRTMVHPVGFKYHWQSTGISGGTNGIIEQSESRMTDARYDYQVALWFLDPTQIVEYSNYVISDAVASYVEANQNIGIATASGYTYADWSNFGTINKFNVSISSAFVNATNTISISPTACLNIVPGMIVEATNSTMYFTILNTSTTASSVTISSTSLSTGVITLNGSLSSGTIAANTIITFSP